MSRSIEETLRLLDAWYNEPDQSTDRTNLLSKLALLELCGWIEGIFDEIVRTIGSRTLPNEMLVVEKIIGRISGFKYDSHLRAMIVELVGEVFARRIEAKMEELDTGELERMKSMLGSLWTKRCKFAHADVTANIASQVQFDAPSWSINQYQTLKALVSSYQNSVDSVLDTGI